MNKLSKILFLVANIISVVVIYVFYPNEHDELFPLYTDATTLFIFLPTYFYLLCGVLPLLCLTIFNNKVIKALLIIVIILFAFINSLNYFSFYSIQVRLLVYLITLIPTLIFWVIVMNIKELYKNKSLMID